MFLVLLSTVALANEPKDCGVLVVDLNHNNKPDLVARTFEFGGGKMMDAVGADDGVLVVGNNGGKPELNRASLCVTVERLRALDSNGDDKLDKSDPGLTDLHIWQDKDNDGRFGGGELEGVPGWFDLKGLRVKSEGGELEIRGASLRGGAPEGGQPEGQASQQAPSTESSTTTSSEGSNTKNMSTGAQTSGKLEGKKGDKKKK